MSPPAKGNSADGYATHAQVPPAYRRKRAYSIGCVSVDGNAHHPPRTAIAGACLIAVIGSGPAGIAATRALVARGFRVTLIDGGVSLEPERRAQVRALAASPPEEWSADTLADIQRQTPVSLGGVPLKLAYGSDFPYRDVERLLPFENTGTATHPSLARGGFSTVWGAAALPYLPEDLADWPVSSADLAPHYRAVTDWMPLSAARDELAENFPLHTDQPRKLESCEQARSLMRDIARARPRLHRAGFSAGWSRLAVRAGEDARGPGCVYCGMCMSGCPYALIYDASSTLEELLRDGSVRYEPDVVVERLEESGKGVTIRGVSRTRRDPIRFDAERVYLACGPVGSTRILLASLDAFDRPVEMKDSQYFLLPWLRFRGVPNPRKENLHTLSQLFIELRDAAVDRHNVHLQVYGYNDLFDSLFRRLLGPAIHPARPAIDALLARLLLIQGYLHSDASPSMQVALHRKGDHSVLALEERRNPETRPTLRRVVSRLLRHSFDFRALPLWPALQIAPAGRGFHSGGTFPMRNQPAEFESDVWGRPHGLARVHVVDSTVFSTIPSTTITFTVMANAHRIASAHGEM